MSRKSFKDSLNPAMNFISEDAIARAEETPEKAPKGYKLNPQYVETRNKRLQLLVQPSVYEKLKARAEAEGRSLNDMAHKIFEEALR